MPYPLHRHRRLRQNKLLLDLVAETRISINDFITPLFVMDGKGLREEVSSMPGYYRYSLDELLKKIQQLVDLGLHSFLLFGKIKPENKDNTGKAALDKEGIIPVAIQTIKNKFPEVILFADVALDPFSSFGHDGIVEGNQIVNDITADILAQVSTLYA